MPTVPIYQKQQVQTEALPNARVNTEAPIEAFGGGRPVAAMTDAARGLGSEVNRVATEEKQKADDIATTDFYTKLAQKKQELFWDPNNGVMSKKGKDAFGALETYGQEFDKYADELEAGLANNDQRQMARKIRGRERLDFNDQVQRHTFQEAQAFQDETIKGGIAVARNDAVLNYGDPEKIRQGIALQESLVMQQAKNQGLPPAMVQAQIQDVRSKTHTDVVTRMLANDQDLNAKAYFDANRKDFTAEDATHLEKALEEGSLRGESQRRSDQILASNADMPTALSEAKKIEEPKLRDAVTERIKDQFQLKKVAEQDAIEQLHKKATDIIDQTGDVNKIPATEWSRFTLSERSALKSYAKQKAEGIQPETNWEKYYELKTLASSPATKGKFLQENIYAYRNQMADSEFKDLVNTQVALREKGDDKILDGFRTDSSIVNDTLLAAGIDATPKPGTTAAKNVALFRSKVDAQVRDLQQKTGKKATTEDIQRISDNLMIEGVTKKGFFFDTRKRAFQLDPGESFDIETAQVPNLERQKIETALKTRGIPVSDARVKELYLRKLKTMVPNAAE